MTATRIQNPEKKNMFIPHTCPNCREKREIPVRFGGKQIRCQSCNAMSTVPSAPRRGGKYPRHLNWLAILGVGLLAASAFFCLYSALVPSDVVCQPSTAEPISTGGGLLLILFIAILVIVGAH
jgi:hypothetical protein